MILFAMSYRVIRLNCLNYSLADVNLDLREKKSLALGNSRRSLVGLANGRHL